MAYWTLAEARDEVADRLILLDLQWSPEIVAMVNKAIIDAQRTLAMSNHWLISTERELQSTVAGQEWYELPVVREGLDAISYQSAVAERPRRLTAGITVDYKPEDGEPLRFDLRPSKGVSVSVTAGGSGYVDGDAVTFSAPPSGGRMPAATIAASGGAVTGITVTDPGAGYQVAPTATLPTGSGATVSVTLRRDDNLLLWPKPDAVGTLLLDYRNLPARTMSDTDELVIDDLLVVLAAASKVAPALGSDQGERLAAEATAYLQGLQRNRRPAGSTFGFGRR